MSVPPEYPRIRALDGVVVLDTGHDGHPGTIAVFLVPAPDGGFLMVESGPGTTLDAVRDGVEQAGWRLADLRGLLLTHIHLDHAGAAGALAAAGDAPVVVHALGAPHLADPTRLLHSAGRIYGDAMERLWGPMLPIPAARISAVEGGETLTLAGVRVRVLATPGHASHHLSFLLDDGTLFTGDSAGVRLPGSPLLRPALPPPELDLEAWQASIGRMRAARPSRLLLTHFGPVDDADAHLAVLPERHRLWAEEVRTGLRRGEDEATLVARMQRLEDAELAAVGASSGVRLRNKLTSDAAMTVMGLSRYWRKRHPEALTPEA